ncbi:hypothetical protein R6Q59_011577 [Mikania micrantha]
MYTVTNIQNMSEATCSRLFPHRDHCQSARDQMSSGSPACAAVAHNQSSCLCRDNDGQNRFRPSYCGLSSPPDQDRAGPSEMQAASDTWKSRFSAFSTRYKESLSKSTRGWKDKLFNKGSSMSNIGSEVRGDMNTGIDNISHAIERLDVRENNRENHDDDDSSSNLAERVSDASESNQNLVETAGVIPVDMRRQRLDDKERPNRQWLRPAECRGSWDSAAAGSEDSGEIREVDQSREIQM